MPTTRMSASASPVARLAAYMTEPTELLHLRRKVTALEQQKQALLERVAQLQRLVLETGIVRMLDPTPPPPPPPPAAVKGKRKRRKLRSLRDAVAVPVNHRPDTELLPPLECKRGHLSARYACNGGCVVCARLDHARKIGLR